MMKTENVIVPAAFGLCGMLLGIWAMSVVGKGWEHEVGPVEKHVLHVIGPVALAPLVATKALGIHISRLNLGPLAGIMFASWAALGIVTVMTWHWISGRRKTKAAEPSVGR